MITAEQRVLARRLILVEGWRIETVARRLGVHHSTIRRALEEVMPIEEAARPSGLDPYRQYLVERLAEHPDLSGVRLLEEIRSQGYQQGVAVLRRYLAKVRPPPSRKAYLRIEPDPAEQAQVDWGSFGHFRIGNSQRPLSAFSMVLSWSRALYVDFSLDQRMETFLAMHRRALESFGGVPRRILYDNLKSVVLHHVGSTVQFNPTFLLFAGHYLFEPTAAPVRYPEAKGRVESSIKYIRQSFFYGRTFSSLTDLRDQVGRWLQQTANARLHATTRERPADRLLIERVKLRALPARPYDIDRIEAVIVSKEARVHLDSNTYSVPPECVGKSVHLRADETSVRVIRDGIEVARHDRCWERRRHLENPEHVAKLLERRKGAMGPRRKDRLAALSTECRLYLQEVARTRLNLQNEVKKLIRLLTQYSEAEVAQGMAQALANRSFGARYVRALIDQARFAQGLSQPPEPVVTGNAAADSVEVHPHDMETYDALFDTKPKPKPKP
jgi:transposase